MPIPIHAYGRAAVGLLLLPLIVAITLTGCAGGGAGITVDTPAVKNDNEIDPADSFTPDVWIDLIEDAGSQNPEFYEYAAFGRQLVAQNKVVLVAPPTLGAQYNAFAWIAEQEIWINEPMFERYPRVAEQATIFLHEMIHLKSGEASHDGPWWSLQDEFAMIYKDYEG